MNESTESSYYHLSPPMERKVILQDMSCLEHNLEDGRKKLTVVVPLYNEKENAPGVVEDLYRTLTSRGAVFEIILVDDGSTDGTSEVLHSLQRKYQYVRVVSHETNMGKTAAMMTGFQHAGGDYIILMDGDGQFVAKDIPKMVEKLEEGYDVVNGWGKKREPITKIIPSLIYNGISRKLFSLNVHQFNLGFKAFKREALEDLTMRRDEHRYILPLLMEKGYTITEVPVEYLPRLHGKSKYGIMRIPYGILDMIALKMELILGERPFRFFGLASGGLISSGIILGLYDTYGWISGSVVPTYSIALVLTFLLSGVNVFFAGYAVEAVKSPRR